MTILSGREILFEKRPMGNALRVAAMDVASMTEIVISCPLSVTELQIQTMALKRLEFVLKKKGIIP